MNRDDTFFPIPSQGVELTQLRSLEPGSFDPANPLVLPGATRQPTLEGEHVCSCAIDKKVTLCLLFSLTLFPSTVKSETIADDGHPDSCGPLSALWYSG